MFAGSNREILILTFTSRFGKLRFTDKHSFLITNWDLPFWYFWRFHVFLQLLLFLCNIMKDATSVVYVIAVEPQVDQKSATADQSQERES